MSYRLKKGQPPFEVVDGDMAGHRFEPGQEYDQVPAAEKHRFARAGGKKKRNPGKGAEK